MQQCLIQARQAHTFLLMKSSISVTFLKVFEKRSSSASFLAIVSIQSIPTTGLSTTPTSGPPSIINHYLFEACPVFAMEP